MTTQRPRPAGLGVRLVEQRVRIEASPSRVYALLTEAAGFVQWMAPEATIEPRTGGAITWVHENGDRCGGHFVELVPDRRIVFTYGWDREDVGMPLGSTTVEITLRPVPTPAGLSTELHLLHRGLSGPMAGAHGGGWRNYVARLTAVAEHRDPGPDPLAAQRVPAADREPPT